jgi:hypothetical protein
MSNEDRKIIPKLYIEDGINDVNVYIDIIEIKYNSVLTENTLQRKVINLPLIKSRSRKLLINSWRYGWKDCLVSGYQPRISMQPSSSIELVDEKQLKYKQNWQVCIMDLCGLIIFIHEYQLVWRE